MALRPHFGIFRKKGSPRFQSRRDPGMALRRDEEALRERYVEVSIPS